jgi:hypothetical protein
MALDIPLFRMSSLGEKWKVYESAFRLDTAVTYRYEQERTGPPKGDQFL